MVVNFIEIQKQIDFSKDIMRSRYKIKHEWNKLAKNDDLDENQINSIKEDFPVLAFLILRTLVTSQRKRK